MLGAPDQRANPAWFLTVNGVSRPHLARLNSNGSLDTNFLGGASGPGDTVHCLALQADGKILIGGSFTSVNGVPRSHLARLNPDGSLDATFQQGMSGPNDWVRSMLVQPDGRIVIVGSFTLVNLSARNRIARLEPNGSLDLSFQAGLSGADDVVNVVTRRLDGSLWIGGRFSMVKGVHRERVALLLGSEQTSAPVIITPPTPQVANRGASAVFSVAASGSQPISYQWLRNGYPLAGKTDPGLLLTNLQPSDVAEYSVNVSNLLGSLTSSSAGLTLRYPPIISTQPTGITVTQGHAAAFTVVAAGDSPLTFQWRFNGVGILGAVSDSYVIGNSQPGYTGYYSVVVSNQFGRATSTNASLNIEPLLPVAFILSELEFNAGEFNFQVSGPVGLTVVIEVSSDLQSWIPIATNTLVTPTAIFSDATSPGSGMRFYRVRTN